MRILVMRPVTLITLVVTVLAGIALNLPKYRSLPVPAPLNENHSESQNVQALLDWIGTKSLIELRSSRSHTINDLELYRELTLVPTRSQTALSALILATYARTFPGQSLSFLLAGRGLDPYQVGDMRVTAGIMGLAATEPIDAIRMSNRALAKVELRRACVDRAEAAVKMYTEFPYLRAVAAACNVSFYRQCRSRLDASGLTALARSVDHATAGLQYLSKGRRLLVAKEELPPLPAVESAPCSSYVLAAGPHSENDRMTCLLLLGNYLEALTWISLDTSIPPSLHEQYLHWAVDLIESLRLQLPVGTELDLQLNLEIAGAANILAKSLPGQPTWQTKAQSAFKRAVGAIQNVDDCRSRAEFLSQSPFFSGMDFSELDCR